MMRNGCRAVDAKKAGQYIEGIDAGPLKIIQDQQRAG